MENWRTKLAGPVGLKISLLVISVMLLNIFDAYASLFIIRLDSRELNPLNRWLMSLSVDHFLLVKTFLVAFLLVALAVRSKKIPSAVQALWIVFFVYVVNAAYQGVIIAYWLAIR